MVQSGEVRAVALAKLELGPVDQHDVLRSHLGDAVAADQGRSVDSDEPTSKTIPKPSTNRLRPTRKKRGVMAALQMGKTER